MNDGSEVTVWRWNWNGVEVDLDKEETKRRMWNREEMKSERFKALGKCGKCGRMCKGERGVKSHQRWCKGPD